MPPSKALFEYRLRESARARHVRLRVTPHGGLEVVVPRGYNPARLPGLLERKQSWIRAALERTGAERLLNGPAPAWKLPEEIRLPALGRVWQVTARETGASRTAVRETGPGRLLIHGRITDEPAGRAALARWLVRQAYAHLAPPLEELSRQLDLSFQRLSFKRQRTRWGSCSHHKSISLNAKLLFLDPALVRYVMVHELCHLAEMNHSPRFWSLVRQHHADFRAHDRELRNGWKYVPRWAD
ncbi:metal-dependent hydrolase [Sulfuricaulis limicola]|uniref:Metal-dependent hydrolase n=1 Tax=Sulfuricaulis limicola TaxID=1620215 RepID=A0A1B4XFY4_9GAMM|nr:SprT family zinc-dependent metalloprotease [Sulfuricaulis limicola]BAV33736.1 metal-dependent hydrolase [Sulfuricaulis limicola]